MKYSTLIEETAERDALAAKTRTGRIQKARLRELSQALDAVPHPPATPRRAPTGERGDFQGNTYAMHSGSAPTLREMRRANKTGRGAVRFMRSRIQRTRRKQRTGGVL